jgi:hydroxypyruvate reductase
VARGTGGRCQELALAAARVLATSGDAAKRITLLAAGTDGRDGPTDASGAFADASLWQHVRESGADPGTALAQHTSHAALDAAHALLRRGPTGTNVMDLVLAVVE